VGLFHNSRGNQRILIKELTADQKEPRQRQGMMFGYATKETENYMPLALDISPKLLQKHCMVWELRREK